MKGMLSEPANDDIVYQLNEYNEIRPIVKVAVEVGCVQGIKPI
jgi:hypothetical protein